MTYWLAFTFLVVFSLSVSLNAILFFRFVYTTDSKLRRRLEGFCTGCLSTLLLLIVIELCFKLFFVQSDGFGFTLANKNWFDEYWRPINSMGYRDIEWEPSMVSGKKIVFAVGDSFVAGHGIERIECRFSNVLGDMLGEGYVVMNVARCGWQTPSEYRAMISNPYRPDIVLFSYYINDIEGAAERQGFSRPELAVPPPKIIRPIIDHSYLFNFVYWRIHRKAVVDLGPRYWDFLQDAYADSKIWEAHRSELIRVISWANDSRAQLIVVVFPNLTDVRKSIPITSKVVELFKSRNIPTIDLAPELVREDYRRITVSPLDPHPSIALHKRVAEEVYELIEKE